MKANGCRKKYLGFTNQQICAFFFSHITYLGEESLGGLVYLVDVCQQL